MAREGERATLGEEAAPLPAGLGPLLLPLPAAAAAAARCSLAALLYRLEPVSAGGSAAPMCAAPGPARPSGGTACAGGAVQRCPSGAPVGSPRPAPAPHRGIRQVPGSPRRSGVRSIPGMRCLEHPPGVGIAGGAGITSRSPLPVLVLGVALGVCPLRAAHDAVLCPSLVFFRTKRLL